MTNFKKDYINYVLHSISSTYSYKFPEQARVKNILERIIQSDDLVKATFVVGKTAGLEILFKYLLYISDKIDKSRISVANLKGNFDYDVENLKKICEKIHQYKPSKAEEVIKKLEIPDELKSQTQKEESKAEAGTPEIPSETEKTELTLIENPEAKAASEEVFELSELDVSVEQSEQRRKEEPQKQGLKESPGEQTKKENASDQKEEFVPKIKPPEKIEKESEPELEIEIKHPEEREALSKHEDESIASEVYNKFEHKFFEEVKILEKLFLSIYNETKTEKITKLTDKMLQSFSEIIEISSELSNLTRQLSFDLTADIFLTINLFFTRAINSPEIITGDRVMLFNSSLSLINNLIRGGNYLNYDVIVEQIEQLKKDVFSPDQHKEEAELPELSSEQEPERKQEVRKPSPQSKKADKDELTKTIPKRKDDSDTAIFKMKWIVKDFEKVFFSLNEITGEYSKFEALEKIDELNNRLRLIARLALSVKEADICKLAEVSYVFLKYLKDYRMDLFEPEMQQIIKYMIFTFKMLLTYRKPEDFDVLVQYLNNPVKIFTDSN